MMCSNPEFGAPSYRDALTVRRRKLNVLVVGSMTQWRADGMPSSSSMPAVTFEDADVPRREAELARSPVNATRASRAIGISVMRAPIATRWMAPVKAGFEARSIHNAWILREE